MSDADCSDPGLGWRAFFWVAAGYNVLIGIGGMLDPTAGTDALIVALLVASFGYLYGLVATDPQRFAPILWAGVAGKLGVVALLGPANWRSDGDPLIGAVVAGDLAFAIGFLVFLVSARRRGG